MEVDETESDSENVAEEDEEEYQMRYYGKSDSEGELEYSLMLMILKKALTHIGRLGTFVCGYMSSTTSSQVIDTNGKVIRKVNENILMLMILQICNILKECCLQPLLSL